MGQVRERCKANVEGDRFRCPSCGGPLMVTMRTPPRPFPGGAREPLPPPPLLPQPPAKSRDSERRPRKIRVVETPPADVDKARRRAHREADDPRAPATKPKVESRPPSPMATIGIQGFDLASLNIAKRKYHILLPDAQSNWVELYSIVGTGRSPAFGRNHDPRLAQMRTAALRHVRFENTSKGLFIKPYESLNGVFRQITRPVALDDGLRFRIGNYIMSFRGLEPGHAVEPQVLEGEHLRARDLSARGELVFLRPDGRPGVRFPILKKTPTVLGRGGTGRDDREVLVDVPLPDDPKVSLQHARIVWDGPEHDRPAIEDMNSKSGTWVEVADRSLVADGDVFWLGELYMKVVAAN